MSAKTATKQKTEATGAPAMGGLGLDGIGELSDLLSQPEASHGGSGPKELSMDLIDEDPKQPRTKNNPGFSKENLEELAKTIRQRGVKSPISVRENSDTPGRYIINHGARRYRGSKLAEKTTIPGFIDNDYSEEDQVIENLQRDELTAREIADFIGRKLAEGRKKGEIAKSIGKSASFVSQHVVLLDLPEAINGAFVSGRANDVTVVNELVKIHKKNAEEVETWISYDGQELTRGSVTLLREYLDDKKKQISGDAEEVEYQEEEAGEDTTKKKTSEPGLDKLKKAIVQVTHDDRPARIILNRRPSVEGWAWLKYEDDDQEFESELSTVALVAILEG